MHLFLFRANIVKSSSRAIWKKACNDPLINKLMLSDLRAEVLEQ